jgi:AcrR family transcriptional regulator
MPRPRSDEKRSAILEAATRIIVLQGLSAPTAGIAKEAGVANGSLFTYFATKTDLFNHLYLELKAEMASATLKNHPASGELYEEFFHAWRNWMNWALSNPQKRRALALLGVADEVTPRSPNGLRDCAHEFRGRGNNGFYDPRSGQCKEVHQTGVRCSMAHVELIF